MDTKVPCDSLTVSLLMKTNMNFGAMQCTFLEFGRMLVLRMYRRGPQATCMLIRLINIDVHGMSKSLYRL